MLNEKLKDKIHFKTTYIACGDAVSNERKQQQNRILVSRQLKYLAFFLASVGFMTVNAQGVLTTPSGSTIRVIKSVSLLDILNDPLEYPIEGSPYLANVYSDAKVFLQQGDSYSVEMRYNIFYDQLEFKERDSVFSIGPDPAIKKIVMGSETLVIDKYVAKGQSLSTYFSRLDSGELTLLVKMIIVFKDSQVKPIEGLIPGRYERMKDDYYFKLGNGLPVKIRSISKLIEELPDHIQEMEEYSKREKISSNSSKDLSRFIRHYNSLN